MPVALCITPILIGALNIFNESSNENLSEYLYTANILKKNEKCKFFLGIGFWV